MPFQPHGIPEARQREMVLEGAQPMAPLEATGLLPPVTGSLVRGSSLPTASVTTHPGCTMRMSVTPTFRKRQAHARSKEDPTRGWLEKVGAAIEDQDETVTKTFSPRQNRVALPQLPKGGDKDTGKPLQKLPCLPEVSLSQAKGTPPPNDDLAPWAGASRSEASFHTLFTPTVSILHSIPCSAAGPPAFCGFLPPDLGGEAPAGDGEQRRRAKLLQGGRARQKGRSRALPRHFKSKGQGMRLPPVPSITPLSFSRSFTFSFFELPPYQSQQHRVQRQQLLSLFMKQLQ